MLKRSRVTGKMDVNRLAASVSRPGIDPRCWVSLAYARDEVYVDPKHGVFIDVTLLPFGEEYTARVPSSYAGSGFGFYAPIHKDDDIVVEIPSGDTAEGLVVVGRLHSAADLPSADSIANPNDVILVVEKDHNLRLKVQGTGSVFVDTAGGNVQVSSSGGKILADSGGGPVFLGADSLVTPNDGVVHGTGIDPFTGVSYATLGNTSGIVHAKK